LARKCGAERLDHLQFPWPGDGIERLREPESGLRPPAAPALSAAERRVAELACDHTNSQIASQLHITVSTVEQHLTRVYRKLGIARRGELRHGLHAS
jgi:DNA-binding CsgD family transcriptional regulator